MQFNLQISWLKQQSIIRGILSSCLLCTLYNWGKCIFNFLLKGTGLLTTQNIFNKFFEKDYCQVMRFHLASSAYFEWAVLRPHLYYANKLLAVPPTQCLDWTEMKMAANRCSNVQWHSFHPFITERSEWPWVCFYEYFFLKRDIPLFQELLFALPEHWAVRLQNFPVIEVCW